MINTRSQINKVNSMNFDLNTIIISIILPKNKNVKFQHGYEKTIEIYEKTIEITETKK